jgi:hypothetical protein
MLLLESLSYVKNRITDYDTCEELHSLNLPNQCMRHISY